MSLCQGVNLKVSLAVKLEGDSGSTLAGDSASKLECDSGSKCEGDSYSGSKLGRCPALGCWGETSLV